MRKSQGAQLQRLSQKQGDAKKAYEANYRFEASSRSTASQAQKARADEASASWKTKGAQTGVNFGNVLEVLERISKTMQNRREYHQPSYLLFRVIENECVYMAEYHEGAMANNVKAPCLMRQSRTTQGGKM